MRPPVAATAADIAIVLAAIAFAWQLTKWVLYPALGLPGNAPMVLRPILGVLAAWAVLRWRRDSWARLGLARPRHWAIAAGAAVALYLANMALSAWVVPALAEIVAPVRQPSFVAAQVRGSLGGFLTWLAIGIIVGGFIEELLFRGFLLNRVADLLGGGAPALAGGVVAQAVLFGALHLYGGGFAFLSATVFALANGVFYLAGGRNLWPVILVHAAWNAVAITGIYRSG
jgi:membrane protease YdiL (CAAX protease family)